MQNKGPLTVFDDQLSVGGKWEMWSFHSLTSPSSRSYSHSREISLAIPIPMGFPWAPWEFPYYAQLYCDVTNGDVTQCVCFQLSIVLL